LGMYEGYYAEGSCVPKYCSNNMMMDVGACCFLVDLLYVFFICLYVFYYNI